MILKMFTIRDSKGGFYDIPHFTRSHGDAERGFQKLAQSKDSKVGQFPEDYDLYYLGDYDDETGLIKPLDTPQHVLKAVDIPTV